jgi:hypothetical protein
MRKDKKGAKVEAIMPNPETLLPASSHSFQGQINLGDNIQYWQLVGYLESKQIDLLVTTSLAGKSQLEAGIKIQIASRWDEEKQVWIITWS